MLVLKRPPKSQQHADAERSEETAPIAENPHAKKRNKALSVSVLRGGTARKSGAV